MDRIINAPFLGSQIDIRRRIAVVVLWLSIAMQVGWMLWQRNGDALGWYDLTALAIFTVLALAGPEQKLWTWAGCAFLAFAFLGSVADRFGLLGEPGTAGVSWGSFSAFVDYTRDVNAFLPSSWATMLAVLVTCSETAIGIFLIVGKHQQFAARVATCLLLVFGLAMMSSLGWKSPFGCDVWLLTAGAWMLALPVQFRGPASLARLYRTQPDVTQTHAPSGN